MYFIKKFLNLYNLKSNNIKKSKQLLFNDNLIRSNQIKHSSPAIKEWNNSIYVYNKNTLRLMPISNKTVLNLIKNYFNLYNKLLEIKPKILSLRKLSSHKIFISKGEFKHTNNKVIINIYVYNRQKLNFLNFLRKISINLFTNKLNKIQNNASVLLNKIAFNKTKLLQFMNFKDKFNFYENLYRDNYILASYKQEILYLYYKRLLILNQLKFRYNYIQNIINIINKLYNKNIEFNLINLKYYYMNSDIFTQSVLNKITKNRRKFNRILKLSVHKVKIINNRSLLKYENSNTYNKLSIINTIDKEKIKYYLSNKLPDSLDNLLSKIFLKKNIKIKNEVLNKNRINKGIKILDSIKNKFITGVRLEAAGRLSKRHTASRSLFKLKYKGSLRNRDSSYKGLSSNIIRGNIRSNIQQTKLNSVAKIGSFGIKGWISNN